MKTYPRILISSLAAVIACMIAALPAVAEDNGPATFFKGVWGAGPDCVTYKLLPRDRWNIYLAPELFSSKGTEAWESQCEFKSVKGIEDDNTWQVDSVCSYGDESEDVAFFFRQADDFIIDVASDAEFSDARSLFHCDTIVSTE